MRADHAAYLASWLEVLTADKRAIFSAAAHAQRAADFLLPPVEAADLSTPADRARTFSEPGRATSGTDQPEGA